MFWSIFIIFIAISIYSELFVYRRLIVINYSKTIAKGYLVAIIMFWVIALTAIIAGMLLSSPNQFLMQAAGLMLFILLLNGVSKAIFAIAIFIGCQTKYFYVINIIALLFIITLNTLIITFAVIDTSNLRIEKTTINSPRVSSALDGLRVVVISDLHTGLLLNKYDKLRTIVDSINKLDADIVINCGDLINNDYRELDSAVIAILSEIDSQYGVYSVLGNHDLGIYIRDTTKLTTEHNLSELIARKKQLGWNLLQNESTIINIGNDSLSITGLNFPDKLLHKSHQRIDSLTDVSDAYRNINPKHFNITISHAPQTWNSIKAYGTGDLTLSGHVHCLQLKVKTTNKGRGLSPAALLYDQWSGLYTDRDKHLYINDGIGYAMMPVRIGTKPEITLITLKQQ